MQEQNKNKGSADSASRAVEKKGITDHHRNLLAGLLGINVVALILLIFWSRISGEIGIFMEYWSDTITSLVMLIPAVEGGVIALLASLKKKQVWLAVVSLLTTIFLLQVACALKIGASITRKAETVELKGGMITLKPEISNHIYQKVQYSFEEDPFIEHLEKYLGVERNDIPENEMAEKSAKVIIDNIKSTEGSVGNPPELYSGYVAIADFQYETYFDQLERCSDKGDNPLVVNALKSIRLEDLQSALYYRVLADENYEDAENRRLLGVHYKELGDENNGFDDEQAMNCYEEASIWEMKAIYSAAKMNDCKKMKTILEDMEKTCTAAEKLAGKDSKITRKIQYSHTVYQIVVEQWTSR